MAPGFTRFVAKEKVNGSESLRPVDFTRECPRVAIQWLLQYGIPWSYWKDKVGYSPSEERLVFLVESEGHLRFSIGRYVGPLEGRDAPRKWYVWGNSHKHAHVLHPREEGTNNSLVLVEDLLSAEKLAYNGFISLPIFGTKVHPCHLYYLIHTNLDICLWLDKDQEFPCRGQAMRLESIINRNIKVITTDKDPKWLSKEELTNAI
jgi:hypothetical protein